ncbi:hypothetical protein Tsubulata_029883 [Turnera subulata]|uniref:Uncharacterized protein n=1 Tax=Turnera subulata TaxID=218843 RepID=A0A9Q0FMR3_9ROSI|nr:hypothetical protein Tsubulata_029883 [Turnera subulata]
MAPKGVQLYSNDMGYEDHDSSQPDLQPVVLRFLPTIAGLYLSRVALRKPLAGFEAVLGCDGGDEVVGNGGVGAEVVEDELGLDLVEVWLGLRNVVGEEMERNLAYAIVSNGGGGSLCNCYY